MNYSGREETVFTYKEAKLLANLSSVNFGSLKSDPLSHEKRQLVEKAIAHLDNVVIQDARALTEARKKESSELSSSKKKGNLNPFVFLYLGHYNLLLERIDDALSAYKEYQDRSRSWQTDIHFLYGLGLCFFRFDCYIKAIGIFKDILFVDPFFPRCGDIHFRLGFAFSLRSVFLEKSIRHYQKSLLDIDNNPISRYEVIFQIASLFERQVRLFQALEFYQDLLLQGKAQLPPYASHHCYQKLGYIYQKLFEEGKESSKNYAEKAIQSYRCALDIDPSNAKTWYYLGRVYAALGNIHDAFMTFRNSIDKAEADADTWCSIGTLYQQQSQSCDALQAYFCAVQIDNKHACAWKNLGVLYESNYQYTDALLCYEKAIAADKMKTVCHQEFCDRVKQIAEQVAEIGEKYMEMFQAEIAQKLPSVSEASQLPIPAELTHRRSLQLQQAEQARSVNGGGGGGPVGGMPPSSHHATANSSNALYQLNGHGIFGPPNDVHPGCVFQEYLGFSAFASQDMLMVPAGNFPNNDAERRMKSEQPQPSGMLVEHGNVEVAPLSQMQMQWMQALQQNQSNLSMAQRQQLMQLQNQYTRFQQMQQRQMMQQQQQQQQQMQAAQQQQSTALQQQQQQQHFNQVSQPPCDNIPPAVPTPAPPPVSTPSLPPAPPPPPKSLSPGPTNVPSVNSSHNAPPSVSTASNCPSANHQQPIGDFMMDFSDNMNFTELIMYTEDDLLEHVLHSDGELDMDFFESTTTTSGSGVNNTAGGGGQGALTPNNSHGSHHNHSGTGHHSEDPVGGSGGGTASNGSQSLKDSKDIGGNGSGIHVKAEDTGGSSSALSAQATSSSITLVPKLEDGSAVSGNSTQQRITGNHPTADGTSGDSADSSEVHPNTPVPSLLQELLKLNHPHVLADGITMRDIVEPNICMSSTEILECIRQVSADGRKRWGKRLLPFMDAVPRPPSKTPECPPLCDSLPPPSTSSSLDQQLPKQQQQQQTPSHHPLLPSVHALYLESKKEAESDLVQEFCLSLPVVVVRNLCHVLRLDMTMFSSKQLADQHPTHSIEILRQSHQSPPENVDNCGQHVWHCESVSERISLKEYAEYQVRQLIQTKKSEKRSNSGLMMQEGNGGKLHSEVRFGLKCDISDYAQWGSLVDEMAKLPPFLRVKGPQNMLSFVGYDIVGVNTLQLSMRVPGCRHYAHQEHLNFCSVNVNTGPGDCEWYCVPQQYWGEVYRLCGKNNVDFLRGNWWPNLEDLLEAKVPVYRFLQRPGDLVWVNTGTIFWVHAVGFCNNISWSVGPLTGEQYEASMERYEFHKWEGVKCCVPMLALTWNLARGLVIADRKLYELMRHCMMRCIIRFKQTEDLLAECAVPVTHHGHEMNEAAYHCEHCEGEIFGHIFTKREADTLYHSYCLACALRMDRSLKTFIALGEYSLSELQAIYDSFHFRTEPIPAFAVSKN